MPNVEKLVVEWLGTVAGGDWPVFGDKPQDKPDQYILVDRTGGPRESMVLDRAEILIEIYHKSSRMIASDKALEIGTAVTSLLAFNDDITRAVVNSTVNLADTIDTYERYQVYCDVYCRA